MGVVEPSVVDLGEAEDRGLHAVGTGVVAPFPIFLRDRNSDFVAGFHQFVVHCPLLIKVLFDSIQVPCLDFKLP